MFKVTKKPACRRVGALCLIAFGITIISCQQEPVNPLVRTNNEYMLPATHNQTDSLRVQDDGDQPPKDVGGGKGSSRFVTDSLRVQDDGDQPPKDVGGGKGS